MRIHRGRQSERSQESAVACFLQFPDKRWTIRNLPNQFVILSVAKDLRLPVLQLPR
jgi:hypothetical protein